LRGGGMVLLEIRNVHSWNPRQGRPAGCAGLNRVGSAAGGALACTGGMFARYQGREPGCP
jgi:hypothetical protein